MDFRYRRKWRVPVGCGMGEEISKVVSMGFEWMRAFEVSLREETRQ